jgi:hypothetical protein
VEGKELTLPPIFALICVKFCDTIPRKLDWSSRALGGCCTGVVRLNRMINAERGKTTFPSFVGKPSPRVSSGSFGVR